jgi:amino acid adenylation domain-containing protein
MAYLLSQLLTDSAQRFSDNLAVISGDSSITYGQLDALSGKLAALLRNEGIANGDRVGIYLGKSIESIVAIFGILKAGAVYVPIDWFMPQERLSFIAANCDMRALIVSIESVRKIDSDGHRPDAHVDFSVMMTPDAQTVASSFFGRMISRESVDRQEPLAPVTKGIIDKDLAYMLYTSGSTGRPKGVMLSHLNALTFVTMAVDFFSVMPDDRLGSHAPLHFDLSVFDLFCAIKAGAAVVLIPEKEVIFPASVAKSIERHRITIWNSVPSALTQLILRVPSAISDLSSLRLILFSGEPFPIKYLRMLIQGLPRAVFFNLYGQTEANSSTWYKVNELPAPDASPVPMGKAFPNFDVFAVDDSGLPLGQPGQQGELYVRAATVALGYWRDAEKSAAHFVFNPLRADHKEIVYKTGDMVTLDEDANFVYIGRRDTIIKSRGYRIDIGEIESTLYKHPAVSEAAVTALPDEQLGNRLLASVIPADGKTISADELKTFCAQKIPRYMIPESFFICERFPRTSTGKVDRQALLKRHITENSTNSTLNL